MKGKGDQEWVCFWAKERGQGNMRILGRREWAVPETGEKENGRAA